MKVQPQANLPVLTLLAHVDATPSDLQSSETAEMETLETVVRPDTNLIVQLRREATSPVKSIAMGLGELAVSAFAVPVLSSSIIAAPALLVSLASVGSAYLAFKGMRSLVNGIHDRLATREPSWNGTRTYHIAPDVKAKQLDSPVVAQDADTSASVPNLSKYLAENMRKYPAQVTAVMVGGHGLAYRSCGGFSVDRLSSALQQANAAAGKKPDVLILEACLLGNLEALGKLVGTAKYAVVSEETMGAFGLPWKNIIPALPQGQMDAQAFGRAVVEASRSSKEIDTLSLIDLDKVPALTTAFEHMASEMRRVAAHGGADEVRTAIQGSRRFPSGTLPIGDVDLRDLGDVAVAASSTVHDAGVRQAAQDVRNALKDAVLSSARSRDYRGASQISVQGPEMGLDLKDYKSQTGMHEWGELLHETRPWYQRIFHQN